MRKDPLINGQYYHIYNRSIAQYVIFNNGYDYSRFIELIDLCRFTEFTYRYSDFIELNDQFRTQYIINLKNGSKLVEIVAQCPMPTHFHLILKQIADNGISRFMAKVSNSYAKYFNCRHQRNGPLFEGKFKNVLIKDDEQMLHVTRYFHLNPTSAGLVKKPEDWQFSSYREYIGDYQDDFICDFKEIIDLNPKQYKKFVDDRIDYQKKLSFIKHLLIDNYNG